jgi:Tfp pilus assembly protein PilO
MKLSLEKRIFATLAFFTISILAVIGFIIFPMVSRIREVRSESEETLEKLRASGNGSGNLRETIQKVKEFTTTTEQYPGHIFTAGQELALITALEKNATSNHVTQKIENANFDAITNQKASIALTVTGEYANTLAYLKGIEELPYFLNLEEITLSPGESISPNSPVKNTSLHVILSIYVNP